MKREVTIRYGMHLLEVEGDYSGEDRNTNTPAYFELQKAVLKADKNNANDIDIFPFLECTETGYPLIEEIEADAIEAIKIGM